MRKTRALKTTTRIYLQDKNIWTDYIEFLSSGSKGGNAIHRGNLYPVHSTLDFPKKFDQSEHDTSIWYHGTAASKACIQPPPPFPPSPGYRSARFARRYFSVLLDPVFCFISPLRSLVPG